MRLAREQIERVQTYAATWTHPDGATLKTIGTITIPGTSGAVMVHAKARIKLAGGKLGACIERTLPLVVDDTGGPVVFQLIGLGALPGAPGESVTYASDLAAADLLFLAAVVGANVVVSVQLVWPGLVGGQSLENSVEIWWE